MRLKSFFIVVTVLAAIGFAGCEQKESESPVGEQISITAFEVDHIVWNDRFEFNKLYVIRSAEDLEKLIDMEASGKPAEIPAGKTLLLCRGTSPYSIREITSELTEIKEGRYDYCLKIHLLESPASELWVRANLVTGLPQTARVELTTKVIHDRENPDEPGGTVEQLTISDFDIDNIVWNDSFEEDRLYVIHSNSELEKLIDLSQSGDYEKIEEGKALLLCGGTSPYLIEYMTQKFSPMGGNNYWYTINIRMTCATALETWKKAVIFSNMPEDAQIELKVNYI